MSLLGQVRDRLGLSGNGGGAGGSATPAGSNTQVQFNNGGAFGASSRFVYSPTTGAIIDTDADIVLTAGDDVLITGTDTVEIQATNATANFSGGTNCSVTAGNGTLDLVSSSDNKKVTVRAPGANGDIEITATRDVVITATNGSIEAASALTLQNELRATTGTADDIAGRGAMVAGAVTVNTGRVHSNSIILLTPMFSPAGRISVGTIVDGTSFDVLSTDAGDAGDVSFLIINPG